LDLLDVPARHRDVCDNAVVHGAAIRDSHGSTKRSQLWAGYKPNGEHV